MNIATRYRRRFLDALERRRCRRLAARVRPLRESPEYRSYLLAQFIRSFRMRDYIADGRAEGLVRTLRGHLPLSRAPKSVLCLGCRNAHELQLFMAEGFQDVTGVDLFSTDPRILPMDMHALAFPPARFDVVFLCHSLEHALEPATVLREIQRVSRPGAVCAIEVPVRFRKWEGREDLHDFESSAGLREFCAPFMERVLHAEELTDPAAVRLVFAVAQHPSPLPV